MWAAVSAIRRPQQDGQTALKKEELDAHWSVADGFLTLSAISFVGAVSWTVQALAAWLNIGSVALPFDAQVYALLGGFGWIVLGSFWYRLSLPFHQQNGEIFKSIFDIYREKVWDLTSLRHDEKAVWRATWAYLQYLTLECPNCQERWNYGNAEKCEHCGFGLQELRRNLQVTGKFRTNDR